MSKAIAGHIRFTKLSHQVDFLSFRKLDWDSFSEDKAAAKERRLRFCNFIDSKALIVFPPVEPSFQHCLLGLLLELNLVSLKNRSHPKASRDFPL